MLSDFLFTKCTFTTYDSLDLSKCKAFDCDHPDLNDFFANDAKKYSIELLGKSYCFILDSDPTIIVAAFTIANDSVKANLLPSGPKKKFIKLIPREKQMRTYPAVLIGRLGVNKNYARMGIGDELMIFIKSWFVDGKNKTGCRYIVVDAYNTDRPLKYYVKNKFEFLCRTDEEEKIHLGIADNPRFSGALKTRLMYFDLITLTK